MSPTTDRPPATWARRFVTVARHPLAFFARRLLDLNVEGRHRLPAGPVVLAANHFSFVDPVLVSLAAGGNVRYLAVGGIFEKSPAFARLITFFGAIPLPMDRVPIRALREALRELESGYPVGVFPEGRRVSYWGESEPRYGAAWLAFAAGVPLVPVSIIGTDATLSPDHPGIHRIAARIVISDPIDPLDFVTAVDPVAALTAAWVAAITPALETWPPHRP